MRGQRNKQAESEKRVGESTNTQIEIIDVSEHRPRRPPLTKEIVMSKVTFVRCGGQGQVWIFGGQGQVWILDI
jgi:hypothetical protein